MVFLKCVVFFTLVTNLSVVRAQSVSEQLDSNSIVDWQRFVIRSSGNSAIAGQGTDSERLEALDKARIAAEDNLLAAAQLLPLNATTRVGDATPEMVNDLRQLVKRFIIVDTRSMSDMTLEVDVELPFTGAFASLLLPPDVGQSVLKLDAEPLCPTCGEPWPEGRPIPPGVKLIIPTEGYLTATGKPYTGLVVDARELEVSPAVLPQIVDETSTQVYGVGYASREAILNRALVGYRDDFDQAKGDSRVGSDPLVIRAISSSGTRKSDVIVSSSDAVLIHAAAKGQNFLKDCSVIIVL